MILHHEIGDETMGISIGGHRGGGISIGGHRGCSGASPKLSSIASYFAAGMTVDQILAWNPTIKREDVESALEYAGWAKTYDMDEALDWRNRPIGL